MPLLPKPGDDSSGIVGRTPPEGPRKPTVHPRCRHGYPEVVHHDAEGGSVTGEGGEADRASDDAPTRRRRHLPAVQGAGRRSIGIPIQLRGEGIAEGLDPPSVSPHDNPRGLSSPGISKPATDCERRTATRQARPARARLALAESSAVEPRPSGHQSPPGQGDPSRPTTLPGTDRHRSPLSKPPEAGARNQHEARKAGRLLSRHREWGSAQRPLPPLLRPVSRRPSRVAA